MHEQHLCDAIHHLNKLLVFLSFFLSLLVQGQQALPFLGVGQHLCDAIHHLYILLVFIYLFIYAIFGVQGQQALPFLGCRGNRMLTPLCEVML